MRYFDFSVINKNPVVCTLVGKEKLIKNKIYVLTYEIFTNLITDVELYFI